MALPIVDGFNTSTMKMPTAILMHDSRQSFSPREMMPKNTAVMSLCRAIYYVATRFRFAKY